MIPTGYGQPTRIPCIPCQSLAQQWENISQRVHLDPTNLVGLIHEFPTDCQEETFGLGYVK